MPEDRAYYKFLVLQADRETGAWTIQLDTKDKEVAETEFKELQDAGSASMLIYTGDFITI